LTGDVFARGYITPQLTLKVAGVLGPYMEIEPYLKFDGNVTIPTSWEWELLGGVDGNLGFEVEILSFTLADFNTTLLNWETTIANDNGFLYYITVTSPNGGEVWQMGTSHNITYNDNITGNVKIELYKSGSYYRTIVGSTSGGYSWNIPTDLIESSSYKVKITSTSNSSVYDDSDNYFTIEAEPQADYITVKSPNGGETWKMGSSYNTTWDDNIISNVKIELYKSGSYYRTISSSTSSDGTYSWSLPTDLTESSSYKVKITSTSNSSVNDQSNNYFTIEEEPPADYITVTSPNGGETWEMGTTYDITWDDNISENVKIELYESGSFYRTIVSSTSSDGNYSWSIPTDLRESSSYEVKITSTSNSSVNDQSNNYFTIEEEPPADYITVTSPNGGETWEMGSSHNITWNDNISSNVKIDLYKSGTYNREIEDSTPSDGTYSWSIPTDIDESSSYKVNITSTSNSSVYDDSDNNFTISSILQNTFSDNFNDGDYSSNPEWTVVNNDDHPGSVDIIDTDYVKFLRTNAGGNGGGVYLEYDLNIDINNFSFVKYDINPVFSDVGAGAGWHNGEYPINVYLYLLDENDNELTLRFCYNYRGGESLYEDDYIRVAFPYCEQNVWLRNEQFNIRDYFPQTVTIDRILIGGNGWNFEGYIDNIEISE